MSRRTIEPVAASTQQGPGSVWRPGALTLALLGGVTALVLLRPMPASDDALELAIERPIPEEGFVSSDTCRSCHPEHYASWHATYHRTMTQEATPRAVVPDWDDITLESRGRTYSLERRGDEFWVDMPDPVWELRRIGAPVTEEERSRIPRVQQQIVMTTGSHHHQTYWVQNSAGVLIQFPWVYHIKDENWVFRVDSFLMPPTDQVSWRVWNLRCLACHSTGGQPRVDSHAHTMFSRVGELGIACEACHGPGREHVEANRNPLRRYRLSHSAAGDPTIVNPARCSPERASQICGQCHSFGRSVDMDEWLRHGDPYRAGDDLSQTRHIDRRTETIPDEWKDDPLLQDPAYLEGRFWPDGTVRTGGREYNGLIESPCYLHGEGAEKLSCISCHSMHHSDPNDQLAAGMEGNLACTQCHDEPRFRERLSEHTHHSPESRGSLCYDCHMPHTSYALFRAIRSHRVESPSVATSVETGRPNGCNLCHLDRTLAWTDQHLAEWYGQRPTELNEDQQHVAASLLWLLKGNAVQRVVTAGNMGRSASQQASAHDWMAPFLTEALGDPYPAVRNVAFHSLQTLPGYQDLKFEFDAPEETRHGVRGRVMSRWEQRTRIQAGEPRDELLIRPDGRLDREHILRLQQARDDQPIIITE